MQGDLCPGVSFWGSLSKGVSVRVSVRETPSTIKSGRYASYWNAFLLLLIFFLSVSLSSCFFLHYVTCECDSNFTSDHIFRMKNCGLIQVPTNISAETKGVGLSHNHITDIEAGVFAHLTKCVELALSDNKLVRIRKNMFQGLRSLKKLKLGHNQISHIEYGSFVSLHLTHLYLASNHITKLEQGDVFKSDHLTLLLGNNPLQCDWKICWIKDGEREEWINLSKGSYGKPYCANFPDVPWDSITAFCSVTGKASSFILYYRLGTVNSKSFVGKVLLQIKWKFELTVNFKHEILGK